MHFKTRVRLPRRGLIVCALLSTMIGSSAGAANAAGPVYIHVVKSHDLLSAAREPRGRAPSRAASAQCVPHELFLAAAEKEHFNIHDPSYSGFVKDGFGNNPGAYDVTCDRGWAVALISRPHVGPTDGNTLFKASGTTWTEAATLGPASAECVLDRIGVPASIAKVLAHGVAHSGEAGC